MKRTLLFLFSFACTFLLSQQKTYHLINHQSELIVGSTYLIVNSSSGRSVSYQDNNNRKAYPVSIQNSSITLLPAISPSDETAYEFVLGESIHSQGNWTFFDVVNNGFLYAASSNDNHLKTRPENIDRNSEWEITFNGADAEIVAQGNNTNRRLKYNSNSSNGNLFSCYSTNQNPVQLYRAENNNSGNYYRTKQSGNWTSLSTWETSNNGISNWVNATLIPNDLAGSVKIRQGHDVILDAANIILRNTEVEGVLETRSFNFEVQGNLGNNYGLKVKPNGIFRVNGKGFANPSSEKGLIETDGILEIKNFTNGGDFVKNYINNSSVSLFTFENHSFFDWNQEGTATMASSGYPYIFRLSQPSDLVIFRLNQDFPKGTGDYGGGTANVFNAVLEVIGNKNLKLKGEGDKKFTGGIQGTGSLQITYETGSGKLILGNANTIPTLGSDGTLAIDVPTNKLEIVNGGIIPLGAEIILSTEIVPSKIERKSGNLIINGILDLRVSEITNSQPGEIQVKGTIKTKHSEGLYGPGAAIKSGNLKLLDGSTVEFNGADQKINNLSYYHLVLSGSGIKTPQSLTSIHSNGSVSISGDAIADFSSNNLASLGENATRFSMDGGRLILGTTGTNPNMGGIYNLTGGVIEFANSGATSQTIRSGPSYFYQNIEISGSNVGNSSGNINLNSGGSFVVKPTGIFSIKLRSIKCTVANACLVKVEPQGIFNSGNSEGFHGFDNGTGIGHLDSSIHSNISNIILEEGSKVNYFNFNVPQKISAFPPGYSHLIISGRASITDQVLVHQKTTVEDTGELTLLETPLNQGLSSSLFAKKGIEILGNGKLTIENNSVLMQDDDAVNSGEISMHRKFHFSPDRNQYNFVISPLINQSIKNIYPQAPQVIYHKESTNFFYNAGVGSYVPGKGFGIKEPPINVPSETTAVFKGIPFNGTLNFQLTYTSNAPSNVSPGYNFVGNPYPSHLDIQLLYNENSNKIEKDFQFWDNRGNTNFVQQGSAYNGAHYAKYNAVNGTGNGAGIPATAAVGELRIPTRFVRPGTGFMVRALPNAEGQNLVFNNQQRSITNQSPEFFGRNSESKNPDRFWLILRSPNGIEYMTAIVYFEDGTNSFGIDDTSSNGSSDDIYSIAERQQIAIQGREPFSITDKVPLGVRLFESGMYVISLFDKQGIFEHGQKIFLHDKAQNEIYDISLADYKFTDEKGEFNDRFEILYQSSLPTENSTKFSNEIISMEMVDKEIIIKSSDENISKIILYDLSQRPMYSKNQVNAKNFSFSINQFSPQIVILKVSLQNGQTLSKKFILTK